MTYGGVPQEFSAQSIRVKRALNLMEKTKKNKSSQPKKIGAMPVLGDISTKLIENKYSQ